MTDTAARMHTLAHDTADSIRKEAAAVRLLQEHDGRSLQDIRDTATSDESGAMEVQDVLDALDELGLDRPDTDDSDVAEGLEEWLDQSRFEGPLSVRRYGYSDSPDEWVTDYIQVVLGTGGPHVEVQHHGVSAKVVAYGWFEEGRTEVSVDPADVDLLYALCWE